MRNLSGRRVGSLISIAAVCRVPLACLAAISLVACAPPTLLRHAADGTYSVDGRDYRISGLPDGALMPSGWTLYNYQAVNGTLERLRNDDRDLRWKRDIDDGLLVVLTRHSPAMKETPLSQVARDFVSNDLRKVTKKMDATASAGEARAVPGGEGFAMTVDFRMAAGEEVVARNYYFCFRADSKERLSVLVFSSPAATFEAARGDVEHLIERIRYP